MPALAQAIAHHRLPSPVQLPADGIQANRKRRPNEHKAGGEPDVQRNRAEAPGERSNQHAQRHQDGTIGQAQPRRPCHVRPAHRSQRSGALNLGVRQGATKGMFSGDWDVSETGNVDMQISSGMGGLASFSNRGTDPL